MYKLAQKVNIDDRPAIENAAVRAKLADWYCQEAGLRYTAYRTLSALSRGAIPGPENSIGKLVGAPKTQDMASFAIDLLEQAGVIRDPELSAEMALFQNAYMSIPGLRIAGGTVQTLKKSDILARRIQKESIMPENLPQGLTTQELADVVEYLTTLKK